MVTLGNLTTLVNLSIPAFTTPRREPPLLECVLSLSLSPGLARVLGNSTSTADARLSLSRPAGTAAAAAAARLARATAPANDSKAKDVDKEQEGQQEEEDEEEQEGGELQEWQAQGCGSQLVRGVVAMLGSGRCSDVVR